MQEWGAAEPKPQDDLYKLQPKKKKTKKKHLDVKTEVLTDETLKKDAVKSKKKKKKEKNSVFKRGKGRMDTALLEHEAHENYDANPLNKKKGHDKSKVTLECGSQLHTTTQKKKHKKKKRTKEHVLNK